MKTREEFINHFLDRLIGVALRGIVHDTDERLKGPLAAGAYARALPEKIASLLDEMYVWLQHDSAPLNGGKPKENVRGQRNEQQGQRTP